MLLRKTPIPLLTFLLVVACDDGTGPDEGAPAALEKMGDSPASAPAGTTLPDPLAVRVTDANGDGVPGVAVTWTVTAGDGSLAANTTTTDANGETSVEWTLGIETGENTATAAVTDLSSVSFHTTAVPGEPASVIVSPDTVTIHAVGDTAQFTAVVQDRWANERAYATVTWSVSDTAIATVDSAGRVVSVKEGVTLLTAAVDTVEGLALVSVHQIPASLTVSPAADTLAEGEIVQLGAVVADSNGVPVTGAEVSWTTSDPAVATVDTTGAVTAVSWSADATVAATSGGLSDSAAIHALGQIAFRTRRDGDWEIFVMHADGSGLTRLTDNTARDYQHAWSPDAMSIAFASDRDGDDEIRVVDLDGGVDAKLTDNAQTDFHPRWSPDGSKIAFETARDGNFDIYVMNADGSGQIPLTSDTAADGGPVWSPAGGVIAFNSRRGGDWDVYVMDPDGTGQTDVTADSATDQRPVWSPDGSRILFEKSYDGIHWDIHVVNADGTGLDSLTNDAAAWDGDPAWSPDGSRIAFRSDRDGTVGPDDIYLMNADGTGLVNLTNAGGADTRPAWSPDGSRIAFMTNRDGNWEIYVMNADGSEQIRLTTDAADDFDPIWRPRP